MNLKRDNVVKCLLQEIDLSEQHTTSYNKCIKKWLKEIIIDNGIIRLEICNHMYSFDIINYKFHTGVISPTDAHKYNLSYTGDILVDIKGVIYTKDKTDIKSGNDEYPFVLKKIQSSGLLLCKFPIMLYSEACEFSKCNDMEFLTSPEFGGSFIVKGKRRYIPLLRSICHNYPLRLYRNNKNMFVIQIRSDHWDRKHRSTSTLELCLNEEVSSRSILFHNINVKIPFLTPMVPISIIIISLGWSLDQFCGVVEIMNSKFWNKELFKKYFICMRNRTFGCETRSQALKYISDLYTHNHSCFCVESVIHNEILPHLNDGDNESSNSKKGIYLAYVFGQLVLFKEKKMNTLDRDSRKYCRLIDPGTSLALLFRIFYLKHIKQCVKNLKRAVSIERVVDIAKIFNHHRLTQRIISALATGTWSQKKKGVSHPMITTNDQAVISQLRRISSANLNNDGKHWEPRMLHRSSYGYECAAETPEGDACGLVTSLAMFCRVTNESDVDGLMDIVKLRLSDLYIPIKDMRNIPKKDMRNIPKNCFKIFDPLGCLFGWCVDPKSFVKKLRCLRRSLDIDPFVSIIEDRVLSEIRIECDKGRMVRPLLVLENLNKLKCMSDNVSMVDLLSNGCLEYVSAFEESNLCVASNPSDSLSGYTHLEVSDVSFVGIIAAMSPFFRHNQGPRLVYWIGMCKQSICTSIKNDVGSATTHNLWYGQKPLCVTKTAQYINMDQIPECINATVIFHPHPCNQEDAIVINKAAIDRGMFISDSIRTYCSENHCGFGINSSSESFEKPNSKSVLGMKYANYDKLEESGIPAVGTKLQDGDVVIGKTIATKKLSGVNNVQTTKMLRNADKQNKRRDKSILLRHDESGVVQSSNIFKKSKSQIAKVRVKTTRIPEIGDKFSSRHSQKGTIGRIVPPEDLPFSTNTGIIPDIVMSPLGITSRMTMGKVIEILVGKAASISGNILHSYDDQDFQTPIEQKLKTISMILKKAGFSPSGKETFIDGVSGRIIDSQIMSGIVSYSKLNHMVARKAHARSTGAVHQLTRQPIEGRRQGGGLRFGPMEAECIIAHSAAEVLKERYVTAADPFQCFICAQCGFLAKGNDRLKYYFCQNCKTGKMIRRVEMGYSTKLLVHEIAAIGIKTQFGLKENAQNHHIFSE